MRIQKREAKDAKYLTRASVIAAIYVILVAIQSSALPFAHLTFGNVQLRLAEGLTLLPIIESAAIPGVFIGCLVSNILLTYYSTFGLVDIIFGSLTTLVAAIITSKMKNKWMGMLPPTILNGFIVSIWVSYYVNVPYLITVATISLGEFLAVSIFGSVFLYAYKKMLKIKEY